MNNKVQTIFLSVIFAVMIFIAGMLFMNHLPSVVSDTTSSLDCNNLSISDGAKLTCLGADISMPYLFLTIFSLAGGIITAKLLL